MKRKRTAQFGSFSVQLVFFSAAVCSMITGMLLAFVHSETPAKASQRTLTFGERVAYQQAIEEVYWRHRIWPKERPDSKPSLEAVLSHAQLEQKVRNYLRTSQELEDQWHRPITREQLQAEMDRMAQHTKQPEVLREIFRALGDDPAVIAECLARPVLAQRLITELNNEGHGTITKAALASVGKPASYTLPRIPEAVEWIDDTWTATSIQPEARAFHTAVWTGSEMIVWGGFGAVYLNSGGRYDPTTDSWTATTTTNAPTARSQHTAVWTGSEMIVWGGVLGTTNFNTGGRYNPSTDSWTATSVTSAPAARDKHTAVWTGSEMIIWGGESVFFDVFSSGGRYNPITDTWTATSTTSAPSARFNHRAVWTGSEMIVWGGNGNLNTGGRYNPSTDSWTATTTTSAPAGRSGHTTVWTGNEMIVWGGGDAVNNFNTGGRYNPSADSWVATSTTNAPSGRVGHAAVWTGSEMIVWAGYNGSFLNTGGRYNTDADNWTATSTVNAPSRRYFPTAAWSGSEMIVWGGSPDGMHGLNTGGRYSGPPAPTPTASPTPTPTPTATATGFPCDGMWHAGPDMPSTAVHTVGIYFGSYYVMGGRSMDGVGHDLMHPFQCGGSCVIKSATYPDNQVSDMACGLLNDSGTYYIYCVGGSAGGQTTATARVFRYNPVTDVIETIDAPWPGNSDGLTLPGGFAVRNNKLYILGGFRINTGMTNQIWEFTPTTNVWVLKNAVLPVARGYIPTSTTTFSQSFIYTAGGSDWNGTTLVDTNDSFRYDPVADSIIPIPNIPRATGETQAVPWGADIYVMGGGRTPPNPSNEIDAYHSITNTWETVGHFFTPRRNFAAASDGGPRGGKAPGHMWVGGGYTCDGVTPLSSTELFCIPAQGSPTPGTPSPSPTCIPMSTPTATPTASPTPTVTPCDTGLIQNGSFETGSFNPGWTLDGFLPTPVVTTDQAHGGTYSALAGGDETTLQGCGEGNEPAGDSSFYQQFNVPPGGGTLSFWHRDCTSDIIEFDWQDAYITNTNGQILQTIFHLCDSTDWVNETVDMTPYAGQTVRIKFLVHQDGATDLTAMYVDDVVLYQPCVTPTPTPTATSTATVTATPTATSTLTPRPTPTARPNVTPRTHPTPQPRP